MSLTRKIIKCKYCRRRFADIDELARHYEVRHKIRRPYAAAVATFRLYGQEVQYEEYMKEYDKMVEEQYEAEVNKDEKDWEEIFEVS